MSEMTHIKNLENGKYLQDSWDKLPTILKNDDLLFVLRWISGKIETALLEYNKQFKFQTVVNLGINAKEIQHIVNKIFYPECFIGHNIKLELDFTNQMDITNSYLSGWVYVSCAVEIRYIEMYSFVSGFHKRLGAKSSIQSFGSSSIFDRNLIRIINRFARRI